MASSSPTTTTSTSTTKLSFDGLVVGEALFAFSKHEFAMKLIV